MKKITQGAGRGRGRPVRSAQCCNVRGLMLCFSPCSPVLASWLRAGVELQ